MVRFTTYREIAKDLDVKLKTSGDSEVILEAFAKWGPKMVEPTERHVHHCHFRYFKKRNSTCSAIDWALNPSMFIERTELLLLLQSLKAITALKELTLTTVNRQNCNSRTFCISDTFRNRFPFTNEVEKFPSGSWAVTDGESFRIERILESFEKKISSNILSDETEAKEQLTELVASFRKSKIGFVMFHSEHF